MFFRLLSGAVNGIEGYLVNVEVDVANGFPRFDIVGLPDSSVRESTDRVRTSLRNSGFQLPVERITVNLAPANMKKVGASFDLAIAIGILACDGRLKASRCSGVMFIGELSLNGDLKPIKGALSMVIGAKELGITKCILPKDNLNEIRCIKDMEFFAATSLKEVVEKLNGSESLCANYGGEDDNIVDLAKNIEGLDFKDVKGQERLKRAVEIAVAGRHNIIIVGPPGSGKTMIAKRIISIMPQMDYQERIEATKIHSVAGELSEEEGLLLKRPFRAPHHTISYASMAGGGMNPKPGEISLAHNGILFLDELPEFNRNVIEVLRQPLEDGQITISRMNNAVKFPSDFMLVASMNPCPCGYYPDEERCSCTKNQIDKYLKKISGPLLDRIDIHIEAPVTEYEHIVSKQEGEKSIDIRSRINDAINYQRKRNSQYSAGYNAQIQTDLIEDICKLDEKARKLMKVAFNRMGMSARAYHKVLKVSRTIADMDESPIIRESHVAEAVQYRSLDRKYWHNG